MSRTRALLGPSTVMATGTVVSRITGIARDIALAAALGFYLVSDAYSLGNSLPTIIYILVVGGALNAVFIPQLVRRMEKDDDGGNAYADRLITLTGSVLLALSILAVVAAPLCRCLCLCVPLCTDLHACSSVNAPAVTRAYVHVSMGAHVTT